MSREAPTPHPGSFRDPTARIYIEGDRVFRRLAGDAVRNFRHVRECGLLDRFSSREWVIPSEEVEPPKHAPTVQASSQTSLWLEHPTLPFISYPYEWPFRALQRAALLQLEIYLEALDAGVTLSDATAYNLQFDGARPLFIDVASFRPYEEGALWAAHQQFCEQFLNPLLLQAHTGAPYHFWYRGSLEGISTRHLANLLPSRCALDWRVLTNVFLQARLQRSASTKKTTELRSIRERNLSRRGFEGLLRQLYRWIKGLAPAGIEATTWRQYENTRLYDQSQQETRIQFVRRFVGSVQPRMLWDLGCNAGEFSAVALESGAERVIGFDLDHGALAAAFDRAESQELAFLPLYLDAANPSPNQGWHERERQGLNSRSNVDGVLALAFSHHMMIGNNIPIAEFLDWLVGLSPTGIVEFVDKPDPQVQTMLAMREDIFSDYSAESFDRLLRERTAVIESKAIPNSDRRLYWYGQ